MRRRVRWSRADKIELALFTAVLVAAGLAGLGFAGLVLEIGAELWERGGLGARVAVVVAAATASLAIGAATYSTYLFFRPTRVEPTRTNNRRSQ